MANAILTGRYIRSTFITDQSEFIDNLQNGKQIGKLLDMPERPQAPKPIFGSGGGNIESYKFDFQNLFHKLVLFRRCRSPR